MEAITVVLVGRTGRKVGSTRIEQVRFPRRPLLDAQRPEGEQSHCGQKEGIPGEQQVFLCGDGAGSYVITCQPCTHT